MRARLYSALFLSVWLGFLFPSPAAERVALVIGVDRYDHLEKDAQLTVAVSDAELIAGALREAVPPFEVNLLKNAEQDEAEEALDRFITKARGAECALIYFAGHGVEYHGENFLLVKDTNVTALSNDVRRMKRRLGNEALALQAVVDDLDATAAGVKLVILDCCRNNPLEAVSTGGTRSIVGSKGGLAAVTPPSGTLISYSANVGQEANDGLFTSILVKHLKRPNLPILKVFAATREEVRTQSEALAAKGEGVRHVPGEYNMLSVSGTDFVFVKDLSVSVVDSEMEDLRRRLAEAEQKLKESTKTMAVAPPQTGYFPAGGSHGFTNSLGMKFLPVTGTDVLFCEHETRVKDYAVYAAGNPGVSMEWKNVEYEGIRQTELHPVVKVKWDEARSFCEWLSRREGIRYRLPTDLEWSFAAGVGEGEDLNLLPNQREKRNLGYPWPGPWPPPAGTGNYLGNEFMAVFWNEKVNRHRDSHIFTAPVKSYRKGPNGLFDLSGNVSEWCGDW
ncbi:MAG: SUMF1/EgtB/PvdO family nonheme iron enzyme, partial [Verrucomicrobiales bacterium]|nr:SUMF1/EgtB/PvdO family nonheme iron enzyme [Verrucomicrobiales bacterium]